MFIVPCEIFNIMDENFFRTSNFFLPMTSFKKPLGPIFYCFRDYYGHFDHFNVVLAHQKYTKTGSYHVEEE